MLLCPDTGTDEVTHTLVQPDATICPLCAVLTWKLYIDSQLAVNCVVEETTPFEYPVSSHAVGAGLGEAFAHAGQHHCA